MNSSVTGGLVTLAGLILAGCGGGGSGVASPVPPAGEVTLTAPANFAADLTGTLELAATAPSGVAAAVEFQVDGMPVGDDGSPPYQASVDTTAYPAGQHIVRARLRDMAGNVSAWASATVSFGGSAVAPRGFVKTDAWVGGFSSATAFAQAGDGRMFVAEQGGALRVVKNGALLSAPFHRFTVDAQGERGLLGVALHPGFAANGWVYVYYTTTQGGAHNRISRLAAAGDVSDGSETVLVDLPALSSATNHNGGALHFGADGKLYVGVGENADAPRAQDLSQPFGKLLRLNDDGSIPGDNPFAATQQGIARAVWAYGLRNPFTFAIEPGSGRMHINDVGANTWEEIDVGTPGANYGWPASEGPDNVAPGVTAPIFAYGHRPASPPGSGPGGFFTGLAIAGGAFYPAGGPFPAAYQGNYFFADFVARFVARLDLANGNAAYAFASLGDNPVDMRVGIDGALYVLQRGQITRIAPP
jgi:glucose/arabinose dehydrogenase